MSPAKRLRLLVIAALTGANLLVLGLSVQSLLQSRQQHILQTEVMTENVANALDQSLANSIEKLNLVLRTVADELEQQLARKQGIDETAMNAFLARHASRLPELEALRVANADGLVILGKGLDKKAGISWADRDYFQHHRTSADHDTYMTKPRIGRVAKRPILGFSQRYNYPDGRFAGVISAPIALDHFSDQFKKYELGPRGTIVLRDAQLGLITRFPPLPEQAIGQIGNSSVSQQLKEISASGTTATTYYTPISSDGFQRLVSYRRLHNAPMQLIVGTASEDYLATWDNEVLKTSTTATGFFLVSLILGTILLRLLNQAERRETTLREQEARLKAIIMNEPECIKVVSADGLLLEMNPAGLAMLEADNFAQVAGQPVLPLIAEVDRERFAQMHQRVIAGETQQMEYQIIGLKGRHCWVETHAVPLLDHEQITHLAVTRNITARKQAEEELLEHRDHLEKLVAERTAALSLAKEVAEAASHAKSAFLANMSHELRTPMNAIMGMTSVVMRSTTEPLRKEQLGKVMTASRHLLGLINNILDISKIEAERLGLESIDFHIGSVLENLNSLIGEKASEKGLHLNIEITPQLSAQKLRGDPLRIGQILLNLTSNAIKFTASGSVTIQVEIADQNSASMVIRFRVIDTGLGISQNDQSRIFSAFEQADTSTTREYGGSGLGLAISKRLVQLMGGDIGVNSQVGVGSTFWFTVHLPRGQQSKVTDSKATHSAAENLLREKYAGSRILLAEDEPLNREVTVSLLKDADLSIDIAEDGLQALELARQHDYAVILMDMQMPNMGGLEATRAIRQLPHHSRTPILAITANAFSEDRLSCLEAGMNDHLSKPVDPDLLFTTLLTWLGKKT